MAIENAKLKLAANLETRINTKTNISIKQAGIDNNETFSYIKRAKMVIMEVPK